MPIRPENRGRCECTGECGRPGAHLDLDGRCQNRHGKPATGTGSRVILTTAHLDHTPENCTEANLKAMCQGCHPHYDAQHHAQTRQATHAALLAAMGQGTLDLPDTPTRAGGTR